jgi:hypothetical protein
VNELWGKMLEDPREQEDIESEIEHLNSQRKKWNCFALGLLVLCFLIMSSSLMIFSLWWWAFAYFLPFVGLFAGLLGVAALAKTDEVEKRAATLSARLTEDFEKMPYQMDVRELGGLKGAVWPRQIIAAAIWGTIITWDNYVAFHFIPDGLDFFTNVWLGFFPGILFGA